MSDRNFLPLQLVGACYALVGMSAAVDACLKKSGWYKKHEERKEKERAQLVQKAIESSKKNKAVPTDLSVGEETSCHNIEPHYFFIWFAIIALAGSFIESAITLEGVSNISYVGSRIFLVMGIPLIFHSIVMFLVLAGKIAGIRVGHYIKFMANEPREPIDEEGKEFVVFATGLQGRKNILFTSVRIFFKAIEKALEQISSVFDFKIFWIPSAFLSLAFEKEKIKNMRIQYRTVTYDLDFGDAYLRFCYEKLLNLITLTLWNKLQGKYYRKWLDKHIRFVGEPPEIGINHFEYHQAQPNMATYASVCPLFATVCGAICAQYILFKEKVNSMRLGGVKMTLKKTFTMGAWTKLYLTTCCGLSERFKEELDNNIIFTGAVNTNKLQQYTQCAFRSAATQASTSGSEGDVEMQTAVNNPIRAANEYSTSRSEGDVGMQTTTNNVTYTTGSDEQEEMATPVKTAYHPTPTSAGEAKEDED